jgi:SpoVK/Ycf46/Vps4 family AAA+-type ATPase
MKVLLFDLEDGSKSLGGKEIIKDMFNFPVLSPSTYPQFKDILMKLYTNKTVNETEILPNKMEITVQKNKTVPIDGVEIDAVILDTFSELSKKYQRSLAKQHKTGVMKIQDWGKLKNTLDGLLEFLSHLPGILVMNVHAKISSLDDGTTKMLPYIDGSTKEDISKWFDFVFYTKTIENAKSEMVYVWHTQHSDRYAHAKDRTQLLAKEIHQDFQLPIEAAKKRGFESVKILIIGEPGTGKTLSLKTLINKEKK